MVHEILEEPPRPNMKTFNGERKIPREAEFDLKIELKRKWMQSSCEIKKIIKLLVINITVSKRGLNSVWK